MIFLSYRRGDTAGHAGRLFDRLADRFGRDAVFMDVDTIRPGEDFARAISDRIGTCDVLIALIGDQWLTMTDAAGRRRVDDPQDFVRSEVEAALQRGIPILPVLVEGARMPAASELPESLRELVQRQAMEVRDTRFDAEAEDLVRAVARCLPPGAPGASRRAAPGVARRRAILAGAAALGGLGAAWWWARRDGEWSLAGKWIAEVENPGHPAFRVALDFREVMEGEVVGSVKFPTGEGTIRSVQVEGRRVRFETVHQPQFEDRPAVSKFLAEWKAGELRGVLQNDLQSRAFVARRPPP